MENIKTALNTVFLITMISIYSVYMASDNHPQQPTIVNNKTTVDSVAVITKKANTKKSFIAFTDSVGFSESTNNYKAENKYGYIGKYQFGKSALADLRLTKLSKNKFKSDTALQETTFKALLSINKYRLRSYITKYNNKVINGIKITESGLLAAAHLVGSGYVKRYLKSNGTSVKADANGMKLTTYLSKFGNYDTSSIPAKRKYDFSNYIN